MKNINNAGLLSMAIGTAAMTIPQACNRAPEKKSDAPRPNIVVILADDMGYSDIGCYGGEIRTPNIDALAENGIRWAQFYNNARSCPSRAVLMTGLYPHQAGMGWMAAADMGRPEYQGYLNDHCVTLAEVLGSAGYETYMSGKWHLALDRHNEGSVKEKWPNARGFDHTYGINAGASNYFKTTMFTDGVPQETGEGFYITSALGDSAASFITSHDYETSPLFLYLAFNAPHWPLHALPEDIAKYEDTYKAGWDALREERFRKQKDLGLFARDVRMSPRDETVPEWDSLSDSEKSDFASRMAIYAAQVDALDQNIGKVVAALKANGQFDNTVIMFMSDNGACAEYISSGEVHEPNGKVDSYESYRINWANLSSTPYREYKHYTQEGGIASPLVVSWPKGIPSKLNGSIIRDYGYFADIMATCVELSGAEYPKTFKGNDITPLEGISLVPCFTGGKTQRGETFWEHEANIAVRDGKWKLVLKTGEGNVYDPSKCELYDMEKDPTELNDLAKTDPERLERMLSHWQEWARKVNCMPLDTRFYDKRANDYRRTINGSFDYNLGGWVCISNGSSKVEYSIDTDNVISAPRTARADIISRGSKAGDAAMRWRFPLDVPMKATVGFTYKTSKANRMNVTVETLGNPSKVAFSKDITLSADGGTIRFEDIALTKGWWRIVLGFGKTDPGTVWIDDAVLNLAE